MNDYLNIHEFFEEIWDRVPEKIVSNKYIDINIDFVKDLTYSFYTRYLQDTMTINLIAKTITDVMENIFKHKPSLSNVVDDYLVNSEDY